MYFSTLEALLGELDIVIEQLVACYCFDLVHGK